MKRYRFPLTLIARSIRFGAAIALCCVLPCYAAGTAPGQDLIRRMLDQVVVHQLANGLKILLLEDHTAPVVACQFLVKTGSRNERFGITGISHLFEHMMFRGSVKYGPEEHSRLVERHGGESNAYTAHDATVYYENIASDQLELVIHLEAERFANLRLDSTVLEEERKVVAEERRERYENNVFGATNEQFEACFYRTTSYSWPVIGWMHDIMSYSVDDIREYYQLHYSPNNVVAVVVGDFHAADAIRLFEKYWGKIPAQPTPKPPLMVEVPLNGERRIMYHRKAELPMLMSGYPIPEQTHEDLPALDVLSRVLSGGQSSRLYKRLVYQEQLARYAGGSTDDRLGPGKFEFYMGMKQGKPIEQGEKVMWEEVERLRNEPVTEAELVKAKNQIEAGSVYVLWSTESRARLLGGYETGYGDFHKFVERQEALQRVTAADVQRVAQKYLDPNKRTVLILVPTKDEGAEGATTKENKQ